jgi:hypothetical protein
MEHTTISGKWEKTSKSEHRFFSPATNAPRTVLPDYPFEKYFYGRFFYNLSSSKTVRFCFHGRSEIKSDFLTPSFAPYFAIVSFVFSGPI